LRISPSGSEEFKSSPDSSPRRETGRHIDSPYPCKIKVEKAVYTQLLQDTIDREKRCDLNIKEMERLLSIMKREKEDIADERSKLEGIMSFGKKKVEEHGSKWNQLLSLSNYDTSKKDSSYHQSPSGSDQEEEFEERYDEINVVA